jgi:FtsH-binding integral membrane protein
VPIARIDFAPSHRPPTAGRALLATFAAIAGSLAADALVVVIGQALFPATRGYDHFQFGDYATLTIVGIVIAALGWPVITRISSAPRWVYSRLAVLVTVVLLLPDLWLLHQRQPGRAVAVLMVMHLAIAVITYYAMVLIARASPSESSES